MDEIWERAIKTVLDDQTDNASARTLTTASQYHNCKICAAHYRDLSNNGLTGAVPKFLSEFDVTLDEKYGVIVVGGGHVGCGAALPSARIQNSNAILCDSEKWKT
ncbi:FAD/NAD(P)-binding domain containing protein [Parasponia andersonii]|uniref:FAD/NAD(P)-binding domain containing protein n=1 Tax=Parasponia andersonii TaxID=3476 RepID=A0A2P5A8M4_PARAD|nr:FAD/NAD(P)-binding domain containing protein [Parasponia andersonii]